MAPDTVAVFRIALAEAPARVETLARLLAPEELERASRFHFDRDRRRFLVARAALRTILGAIAGRPPEDVRFAVDSRGKPSLAPGPEFALPPAPESGLAPHPEFADLAFNLSHSDDLAVVAVARTVAVGVDIERIRPLADLDRLAASCLTSRERGRLAAIEPGRQPEAFLRAWTCKEAYAKAIGAGLSLPFEEVEVEQGLNAPPRLLEVRSDPTAPGRWELFDLALPAGFVGTLAVEGTGWGLEMRDWLL